MIWIEEQELLKLAEQVATEAHKGQTRWNGEPYIIHPKAVANSFENPGFKIIAFLHDVIEDTFITYEDLIKKGIPEKLAKVVSILSRRENETYYDFILRISKHDMATKVKIGDLNHNLSDLKEGTLKDKYRLARYVLRQKLRKLEWRWKKKIYGITIFIWV